MTGIVGPAQQLLKRVLPTCSDWPRLVQAWKVAAILELDASQAASSYAEPPVDNHLDIVRLEEESGSVSMLASQSIRRLHGHFQKVSAVAYRAPYQQVSLELKCLAS